MIDSCHLLYIIHIYIYNYVYIFINMQFIFLILILLLWQIPAKDIRTMRPSTSSNYGTWFWMTGTWFHCWSNPRRFKLNIYQIPSLPWSRKEHRSLELAIKWLAAAETNCDSGTKTRKLKYPLKKTPIFFYSFFSLGLFGVGTVSLFQFCFLIIFGGVKKLVGNQWFIALMLPFV